VVIKGKSVAGATRVAGHLERTDTNERMEVKELKGVAADNLPDALREMEAVASANPNCKKPFYHASINTRADERLTDAQRLKAIDRLEKELGLTDQPRAIVVHEKEGREHCHIVWSRLRGDDLRVISDSNNYRAHEIVARELEREFGHERVQGAHIERDGKERPERTASHKEHQQEQRTGISAKKAREQITALWKSTDSGQAFQQALQEKGWMLAKGDRRDFVAVDRFGGVHSLARRIEGAKAADVRTRLADIDPKTFATAADAREVQLARLSERERDAQRQKELAAQGRLKDGAKPAPRQARRSKERDAASVAAGVTKGVGGLLGIIERIVEGAIGGGSSAKKPDRDESGHGLPRDDHAPLDGGRSPSPDEQEKRARQIDEDKSREGQRYFRDHDREVPEETRRDADIERAKREEERGRERRRGE
jgi:hypothetical protein